MEPSSFARPLRSSPVPIPPPRVTAAFPGTSAPLDRVGTRERSRPASSLSSSAAASWPWTGCARGMPLVCSTQGQGRPGDRGSPAARLSPRTPRAVSGPPADAPAFGTAPADGAPEENRVPKAQKEAPFNWGEQWYCVGDVTSLEPSRPHPTMVLGKRLVLWFDRNAMGDEAAPTEGARKTTAKVGESGTGDALRQQGGTPGAWRCFLDACPHRLAPLSQGQIDQQGLLQCYYHGWTFSGDGRCQGIPDASKTGPEQKAAKSFRACAVSMPVKEALGLLFVWPASGEAAAARAAATPLPIPNGVPEANPAFVFNLYTRTSHCSYNVLAENFMDLAHIPFAHHGVISDRSQAAPYPLVRLVTQSEGSGGYVGVYKGPLGGEAVLVEFNAPCCFTYYRPMQPVPGLIDEITSPVANGDTIASAIARLSAGLLGPVNILSLFFTPSAPGVCCTSMLSGTNSTENSNKNPKVAEILSSFFLSPIVKWHLLLHDVTDGEVFLLHVQEKVAQALKAQSRSLVAKSSPKAALAKGTKDNGATDEPSKSPSGEAPGDPTAGEAWGAGGMVNPRAEDGPRNGSGPVLNDYYMPTAADRFVIAFRRWLGRHGGAVPWPPEFAQSEFAWWDSRENVLNRYKDHTAGCIHCSQALGRLRTAQMVSRLVGLVLLVIALATGVHWAVRIAGLAAVGVCMWASVHLDRQISKLVYVEEL